MGCFGKKPRVGKGMDPGDSGRKKIGKTENRGWFHIKRLLASLAMPGYWSGQSVLSSHQTPFLTVFLGEGLRDSLFCVHVCACRSAAATGAGPQAVRCQHMEDVRVHLSVCDH